jgi:hypothetical protein
VYYSAASLEKSAYARLLDALFDKAGVARPVRVSPPDSGVLGNIESRFVEAGSRKLLYIVNFGAEPARLRVQAPQGFFNGLRELRGETFSSSGAISVASGETKIYEMF